MLQRRLHPTRSRGHWCCRCCCCCRYCHAATSCRCSSGPPADTRYRDRRGGWTPPSRRIFRHRTQLLTRALWPPTPLMQQGQQYRRSTVPPPLPRPMAPVQRTTRAPRLPPQLMRPREHYRWSPDPPLPPMPLFHLQKWAPGHPPSLAMRSRVRLRVRGRRFQIAGRACRKLRAVGVGRGRGGNCRTDTLLRG